MKYLVLSPRVKENKFKKIEFIIDEELLSFIKKLNFNLYIAKDFKKENFKFLKNSSGLILSGGGDIWNISKKKIDKLRDNKEKKLYEFFLTNNKPIFGICRGFQLIANYNGIDLKKKIGHVRKSHKLLVKKSKYIKAKKIFVNSYHNYIINTVPKNFMNVGCAKDGSIEIMEHKTKKILCTMFHPERNMKSKNYIIKTIKNFFK
jgi:putative glutamine amidotransferase